MNRELKIGMLMPVDENGMPFGPANYDNWCTLSKGKDGIKIIFLKENPIFEEYGDYVYISIKGEHTHREFLRYDVRNDIIYLWKNAGTICNTIEDFEAYCKEENILIKINNNGN